MAKPTPNIIQHGPGEVLTYPSVKEQYASGGLFPSQSVGVGVASSSAMQDKEEALAAFTSLPGATRDVDQYTSENRPENRPISTPIPADNPTPTTTPHRKKLTRAEIMGRPFPAWLVHGVFPETGLAALAGQPGSGKSFLAIELACAIAGGCPFFGLKTKQRPVYYVILEGAGGLHQRLSAWEAKHGKDYPDTLEFDEGALNLMDSGDRAALLEATPENGVVIIDTLAQSTAGQLQENDSEDMGKVIAACNEIIRTKHALVILVCHVGKDEEKGIRGHSSLLGALDTQVTVCRPKDSLVRSWFVAKSKDGEDGRRFGFELRPVAVGERPDGTEVSSAFVMTVDLAVSGRKSSGLGGKVSTETAEGVFSALISAMQENDGQPVTYRQWKAAYFDREGSKDKATQQRFSRGYAGLVSVGRVKENSGNTENPLFTPDPDKRNRNTEQ